MSNLVFCPFEVDIENMASDLAQLEAEYAEKRKSESEIQDIISKVDQRAIEELKSTEEELQEVNLKCAAIVARLERAAGGAGEEIVVRGETPSNDFETTQGGDPIPPPAHQDIINTQRNSSQDDITLEGLILSPVSASSDFDDFSVASDIDAERPQVSDPSANASDLLSLTQRYHALCHTIDSLRDGIRKQAEALNAKASAKHDRAKARLEASRERAREVLESMKEASTEGKVYVQLPWLPLANEKSPSVVTSPRSPASWDHLRSVNYPKVELLLSRTRKCDSQGLLTPPPTAHPHSPCFDKYEEMINITRSKSPGDLWPWDIPWPVLPRSIHNFPVKTSHSLMAVDVLGGSMKKFIESYASWKAQPINQVTAAMLVDWTSIVDKTPVWRAGQKEMAELIVHHLACPATVPSQPVPTIVSPKSTLTPNSFSLATCSTTVVDQVVSASPFAHEPVLPSPLPVVLVPAPASIILPSLTCFAPTIEPLNPANPPAITSPHPNPHKDQALLQQYEQRMNAAKITADRALMVPSMPWPVLHSQSCLHLYHPSLSTTTLQSNMREFIHSYSQWKHSTFEQASTAMLSDWALIVGKLKNKNVGKQTANRVINHLRTFSK